MRVLIMGATGLLGHTLAHAWKDGFDVVTTVHGGWHDCDTCWPFEVQTGNCDEMIDQIEPDVVLNCIGIVKQRPSSLADMIEVNSLFPHRLSQACKKHQARLIHISTDCVFSGDLGNYRECDRPDPADNYGMTKLLGEPRADLTIRTSFVGRELPGREHHGLWEWLRSHPRGATVSGYGGVLYSGLVVLEFANVLREIILDWPYLRGLYHVSSGPTSKHRLLVMINEICDLGLKIKPVDKPNNHMTLASQAFGNHTGYKPPTWSVQIRQYHGWTKTRGSYEHRD